MYIKQICYQSIKSYKSKRKLSETYIRNKLKKEGWEIWRGGYLNCIREENIYPNVYNKYSKLNKILGEKFELLQYICKVHHGMPDFLCYRRGELKFVECKLENEALSKKQKKCFLKLQEMGFIIEIHRFVFLSKIREAYLNLLNGKNIIKKRQKTLR